MSFIAPTIPGFDNLVIDEVYFEHDGPKFFSLKCDDPKTVFIATAVDENEDTGAICFIYCKLSLGEFIEIRTGQRSFGDAMRVVEDGRYYMVETDYAQDIRRVKVASVARVKEEWLPSEGVFFPQRKF